MSVPYTARSSFNFFDAIFFFESHSNLVSGECPFNIIKIVHYTLYRNNFKFYVVQDSAIRINKLLCRLAETYIFKQVNNGEIAVLCVGHQNETGGRGKKKNAYRTLLSSDYSSIYK